MNEKVINLIKSKYTVTVIGEPTLLLGMHITRDRKNRTITLSQSRYIRKILEKAGMLDSNPVSTPMDPNVVLKPAEDEEESKETSRTLIEYATRIGELLYAAHATRPDILYATRIGELLYAAHATRPDILYATVTLAQFTRNPAPEHWTALKRVFRYLKGSIGHKLTYGRDPNASTDLTRYTDSDWASNVHRKSISGYVFMIAGGAVAWSSKKQSRVALSTAEAEYVAATHAIKQLLWHRNLFKELGLPQPGTSILLSDNQAAISISHNPEFHA
jgi:hypothetical protein